MQGFNGILADESGFGKKAQVTGFLSYLAESHKLWGPFLIVAPSSSICYWQQVLNRMCPKFKAIKYSGNTQVFIFSDSLKFFAIVATFY